MDRPAPDSQPAVILVAFPPSGYRDEVLRVLGGIPGVLASALDPRSSASTAGPPPTLVVAFEKDVPAVSEARRGNPAAPVIAAVCEALSPQIVDRVLAAGAGIVLPRFLPDVLARLLATAARARPEGTDGGDTSAGIVIAEEAGIVLADGKPLTLTPTELLLLRALAAQGGRPLSRKEILRAMHGGPGNVQEDSINFTVHSLRAKLGRYWPSVRTVWGKGYAWQPATESGLRRRRCRRIALATVLALAVFLARIALLRPDAAPGPAPDRRTGDLSQLSLGRESVHASAAERGVPGHEPSRMIDGDAATWYESASPAVRGWHWLCVDWATNKTGRVSVLLGRPEDGPPHPPVLVEVSSDGRTWRLGAETGATTNAAVFVVSESFQSLRVRPAADSDRPLAVREIAVDPVPSF